MEFVKGKPALIEAAGSQTDRLRLDSGKKRRQGHVVDRPDIALRKGQCGVLEQRAVHTLPPDDILLNVGSAAVDGLHRIAQCDARHAVREHPQNSNKNATEIHRHLHTESRGRLLFHLQEASFRHS